MNYMEGLARLRRKFGFKSKEEFAICFPHISISVSEEGAILFRSVNKIIDDGKVKNDVYSTISVLIDENDAKEIIEICKRMKSFMEKYRKRAEKIFEERMKLVI